MHPGVQRFIDDMTELGLNPSVEAGLVIYQITPIDGAQAGVAVETGVSAEELAPWPQAPPHWVHFPDKGPTVRRRRNLAGSCIAARFPDGGTPRPQLVGAVTFAPS